MVREHFAEKVTVFTEKRKESVISVVMVGSVPGRERQESLALEKMLVPGKRKEASALGHGV